MTHRGPPDFNEMAFRIVEAATAEDAVEEPDPAHVTAGRQGGKARAEALSAERRAEIARKAARARWQAEAV